MMEKSCDLDLEVDEYYHAWSPCSLLITLFVCSLVFCWSKQFRLRKQTVSFNPLALQILLSCGNPLPPKCVMIGRVTTFFAWYTGLSTLQPLQFDLRVAIRVSGRDEMRGKGGVQDISWGFSGGWPLLIFPYCFCFIFSCYTGLTADGSATLWKRCFSKPPTNKLI